MRLDVGLRDGMPVGEDPVELPTDRSSTDRVPQPSTGELILDRETLQGAWARVPSEGRVNARRNPNALHEGFRGHQLPGADQQP
jgi:hypothetical protein